MKGKINRRNVAGVAVALLLSILCLSAQGQATVSGTVKDKENGTIMSGVTVLVPGTHVGTITNARGGYSITIPNNAQNALIFNFLGYEADTVQVGAHSVVDVLLKESTSMLAEIVVEAGYGTMRRTDITGSSVSVKIDEREAALVTSFDRLLQGRAAGVQVTTGSSAPGGAVSIVIRGASSFNSSSQPLYVVDGVILNSSTDDVRNMFSGSGMGSDNLEAQNPLASINPSDILSMEVLKDASATAIYGSQGANGVVLITTKLGNSSKPRIEFSTTLSKSWRSKKLPLLSGEEYVAWRNEMGASNAADVDSLLRNGRAVDWQDYSMRSPFSTTNRITVSGKSEDASYYIAAGFRSNNGVIRQANATAADLRANLDVDISKRIRIGTRSTFSYMNTTMLVGTDANGAIGGSIMRQMLSARPLWEIDPEDLEGDEEISVRGPYTWFKEYDDKAKDFRIISNLFAQVTINPWLSFKSEAGVDYRSKVRERFYGKLLNQMTGANGRGGMAEMRSLRYNMNNTFNFNKTFPGKKHRLSGVVGMTINSTTTENITNNTLDFYHSLYRIGSFPLGQTGYVESYTIPTNRLVSYLARGSYTFKERYTTTATFRADGSSKFSKKNRFSYFPSLGLAWRVSQERFLQNNKVLTNLKVRAGWGQTGNQGAVSPYQTLANYNSSPIAAPGTYMDVLMGYSPDVIPNPDLRWEASQTLNAGVDFSLFKDRISGIIDLYRKDTQDLLQRLSLPPSSGSPGSAIWANRGSIENMGVEVALDLGVVRNKDIQWNVGGNISFNRNKITDSGREFGLWGIYEYKAFLGRNITSSNSVMRTPANIFIEGKPVGLFWGYKTDGIIQEGETASVFNNLPQTANPGNIRYVNFHPDNMAEGVVNDKDMTIIGDPNPKFTYGFYTSVLYKGFSLNFNFNGVYGNDILNANLVYEEWISGTYNIRKDAYFKAWRPDAPSNNYPGLNINNSIYVDQNNCSDRLIEDGSFLRLSNATLSYHFNLPPKWAIRGLTLSLTGTNLFCLSSYKGWDPEVNSFTFDPMRMGIDWGSYPGYRSVVFGAAVTF